jgi:hypothetical protein
MGCFACVRILHLRGVEGRRIPFAFFHFFVLAVIHSVFLLWAAQMGNGWLELREVGKKNRGEEKSTLVSFASDG